MERLGRYELHRVLGEGGAGRVYEAVLLGPGGFRKPVALKVLLDGGDALRREARIGGLLRHRHLVDVYEIGEVDGQWFCAMERCAASLARFLPLPPRAVVEVGLQVCAAMQYAHEELGLIHLDIKPDNLLLSPSGEVKLADLGLAQADGFTIRHRGGTPGYMPPEQARGEPVDIRADIYALGVTLVELATGGLEASHGTLDWLGDQADDDAQAIPSFGTLSLDDFDADAVPEPGGFPAWLAPAVERALESDPEARWPDMAALADALRELDVEGPGLQESLGSWTHRTSPSSPHEVVDQAGRFFGRRSELTELAELLEQAPIVTLTGPAGIGKSRLASEAVRRQVARHGGAAGLVDLGAAASRDDLISAVARALSLQPSGEDPVSAIERALAGRGRMVLVLDGFERIAEHRDLVERWSRSGSQTRFVLTSRTPTGVGNRLRIGPLANADARALLVDRAHLRGVEIAEDPDLDGLVTRLDGLPLAVELAAGRLGVLSVRDVLERLGLSLLRAEQDAGRGTLEAALDETWSLLTPEEASALVQLSEFVGGFTLQAAEAVVRLESGSLFEVLDALVDRAVVHPAGDNRLRLLAGVQEFARRKRTSDAAERRHAAWVADLPDTLGRRGSAVRIHTLTTELDNLVAAVRRAVARGDADAAAWTLDTAWEVLGLSMVPAANLELARTVAEMDAPEARTVRARTCVGTALRRAGRFEEATEAFQSALETFTRLGDRSGQGELLAHLGLVDREQGRFDEAEARLHQAMELHRAVGDRRNEGIDWGTLGLIAHDRGLLDDAREHQRAALRIHEELGDSERAAVLTGSLGVLDNRQGRLAEAQASFERAHALHRELGNRRFAAEVSLNLGILEHKQGHFEAADAHYAASHREARETGYRLLEGAALGNRARLRQNQGRIEEAIVLHADALAIHTELRSPLWQGIEHVNLGTLHLRLDQLAEAREHLELGMAIAVEAPSAPMQGIAEFQLAKLDLLSGDLDRADTRSSAAIDRLRKVGDPTLVAGSLAVRAEVLWARGAHGEAHEALEEAIAIAPPGNPDAAESIGQARRRLGLET